MASSNEKDNIKTYSFSVDSSNPKYAQLIQYLDGLEKGSRSFIIRQILNSYILGQGISSFAPPIPMDTINVVPAEQNAATVKVQEEPEPPKKQKTIPPQMQKLKNQFT